MPTFVMKTPRCEAQQWTGSNLQQMQNLFSEATKNEDGTLSYPSDMGGTYIVPPDYWLLRNLRTGLIEVMDPVGFENLWGS